MAGTITSQELFSFLLPEQVSTISDAAERVSFKPGEVVYSKGERATDFFIVLEGEITLRLPGSSGVGVVIDQLGRGAIFGGALGTGRKNYALSAHCTEKAKLLRVRNSALKSLMKKDVRMGYHLQAYISDSYFRRYVDTMNKLQAIVMNLPIEA
jgi:cAMP-dependent protein kinase regulator